MRKTAAILFAFVLLSLQSSRGAATTITIKNRSTTDRIQWVHTTIPFPKGEVKTEADLYQYSVSHGTLGWRAMKWHFTDGVKDSVALAALRIPVYLTGLQEVSIDVVKEAKPNQLAFQFGPNLTTVLNRGTLGTDLFAVAKLQNDDRLYFANFLNNFRVIFDGQQSKTFGFHTNFEDQAISMTIWM